MPSLEEIYFAELERKIAEVLELSEFNPYEEPQTSKVIFDVESIREQCVEFDIPANFNDMLFKMKERNENSELYVEIWRAMRSREIFLISAEEAPSSKLEKQREFFD